LFVLLDIDQVSDQAQSESSALISAKDETITTLHERLEERQAHTTVRRLLMVVLRAFHRRLP
jgi:hypothetical protein